MSAESRREFLWKASAAGLGMAGLPALLGAARPGPFAGWQEAGEGLPAMTIVRLQGGAPAASEPGAKSVATRLTEKALEALGGMKRFVKKGDVVWVKPNIGWNRTPELAGNTHPDVVATLVRLCLDAGAKKVKVGDNPCNDAKQSYTNSGIAEATRAAGGEVVYLERSRFKKMTIGGNRLKEHPVYPEIIECDLVISVPVCKHHSATTATLCMKNYMGVVDNRSAFHQDLPTAIADITQFMKPRLSVLDATRILTAHGPTGGDIKDVKVLNTIAAGTDIVALDAFGCELLGHKPESIGTVTAGAKYGLGKLDYRSLALKELQLA